MADGLTFPPSGTGQPGYKNIGAGGYVTGGDIADDGTIVARLDTSGPVIRYPAATEWERLFTAGVTVDASSLAFQAANPAADLVGTYAVAICATDSDRAYAVIGGFVWKGVRSGTWTWTKAALAQKSSLANSEAARTSGDPLAVDPENPDVVFFGASDGLHYSVNSGTDWTSVSTGTIPAPTAGERMIVVFDRSSTVTDGKTQGIYVFVNGSGLYHSTNGGTSWAAVTASTALATSACRMRVSPDDGYVHLVGTGGGAEGQYRRWSGAAWVEPAGVEGKSLALSTINAGRMWLIGVDGTIVASTDNGANWSGDMGSNGNPTRIATDIPWHAWTVEEFMSHGDLLFDPIDGRLWMLEGIGAWYKTSPPTTISGDIEWTEASKGIENMVGGLVACAPNGDLLYASMDRDGFVIPRAQAGLIFPSTHIGRVGVSLIHGGNIDYAFDDPTFLVGCELGYGGQYSTDSGVTWTPFSGDILTDSGGGSGGGNIIALSTTVFLQITTLNGPLMRTIDGGDSWDIVDDPFQDAHAHSGYSLQRRILVKDNYVAGKAYYYLVGPGDESAEDLASRGIWVTTDYGANWERVTSQFIIGFLYDQFHGKLVQVGPDDWLWCGGDNALGLWRSTDGMATWAQVGGTDNVSAATGFGEVFAVAVGPGVTSGIALWAAGHRQPTPAPATNYTYHGLWRSLDNGATWTRITQFIHGYYCWAADMAADPDNYGLLYVSWPGEGLSKLEVAA